MRNYCIWYSQDIINLQKKGNLYEAAQALYLRWKECPMDLNALLSAGMELWYALLMYYRDGDVPWESTYIWPQGENNLHIYLDEVYCWGEKYFSEDAMFNAYFGYMLRVMPYFFRSYKGDYDGWQRKGEDMMHHSFELEPENPLTKALHYESGADAEYVHACSELWKRITPIQWGCSAMQQYLFHILHGDMFYNNAYSPVNLE